MASEWYLTTNGKKTGPYSSSDLKQLAASGQIASTDLVWKEGMASSLPASKVSGLLPAVNPAETISIPPPIPQPSLATTSSDVSGPSLFGRAKSGAADLASKTKAAGQLTAKQAERTKIVRFGLPGAYADLGKQVHATDNYRHAFEALFQAADKLRADIQAIESRAANQAKPQAFTEKAKSAAIAAKDMVHAKALQLRLNQAHAELGRTVFEKYVDQSSTPELIDPIKESIARLAVLDSEIAHLSQAKPGQWITPKRLAIAGGILVFVCLAIVGGSTREDQTTNTTRTAVQRREATTPKLSPAAKAGYQQGLDAGQHLVQLFRTSRPSDKDFVRNQIIETVGIRERDRDEILHTLGPNNPSSQGSIGYCLGVRTALTDGGVLP